MKCPCCKEDVGQIVYDSRSKGGECMRRRECLGCGYRFKTVEAYDPHMVDPKFDGIVGKSERRGNVHKEGSK